MVGLFEQIGLGQWFRIVTGVVEVTGAVALLLPAPAAIAGLWLGFTMVWAVATCVLCCPELLAIADEVIE